MVPWSLRLLTQREAVSKSINTWGTGKGVSFSRSRETLPAPRCVHKSDPRRWTKFRAQANLSLSDQEKIVKRKNHMVHGKFKHTVCGVSN